MVEDGGYNWPLYFLTPTLGKIRKNTRTTPQCEWTYKDGRGINDDDAILLSVT